MDTYYTIVEVLLSVYSGKNLKDILTKCSDEQYIAKIKNHCFGILRNYYAITYCLSQLVKKPVKDVSLLIILQIAIFEIKYSVKPEHAVTNDIVEFTKVYFGNTKLSSFVNAVCRNYIRVKNDLDLALDKDYSLKYNLPEWFICKLKNQYREEYKSILEGLTGHPAFGLRVNNRSLDLNSYLQLLDKEQVGYGLEDGKLFLNQPLPVDQIPLFAEGAVTVQDIAAQYTYDILRNNNVIPEKVLDACAAPGGKTCQILENYDVKLLAIDNSPLRLQKIEQNLNRLGLKCDLGVADATQKGWWDQKHFDLIIADVPCSATGTLKRNPDIKINRSEKDLDNFIQLQRSIIKNLLSMLQPGGYMLYITCSVFKDENQFNMMWLTENMDNISLVDEIQILPARNNDGLYYALIQKK